MRSPFVRYLVERENNGAKGEFPSLRRLVPAAEEKKNALLHLPEEGLFFVPDSVYPLSSEDAEISRTTSCIRFPIQNGRKCLLCWIFTP